MPTRTHPTRRRAARGPVRRRSGAVPAGKTPPVDVALTTLTFNIGAAALPRAGAILQWLRKRSDDLIVLSETSAGPGTEFLRKGLEAAGYATYARMEGRDRGVLVATRLSVREPLSSHLGVTLPWRVAGVVLDTSPPVALVGVYVPSRDRSPAKVARKRVFIESLLDSVRGLPDSLRKRLLLVGDYNAVARHHDPPLPGFFPYEYELHDELGRIGLTPAHELRPRGSHPHSWIGRTGIGYLYDYVHVGVGLRRRVERCSYLHGPRTRGLSDHAALAVRLRLD